MIRRRVSAATGHGYARPVSRVPPEQCRDVRRKEHVTEQRIVEANMGRNGSAEVAGPENRAEGCSTRDEVEQQERELNDA